MAPTLTEPPVTHHSTEAVDSDPWTNKHSLPMHLSEGTLTEAMPPHVSTSQPVITPSQAFQEPPALFSAVTEAVNQSHEASPAAASETPGTPPSLMSSLETSPAGPATCNHSGLLNPAPATYALPAPYKGTNWPLDTLPYLQIYDVVRSAGLPNYLGARIPLPHGLHMPTWRHYLTGYQQDSLLCDFLEFGWPVNYTSATPPTPATANHGSALAFPQDIQAYLDKEKQHGALLGPFTQPPFFPWLQTNAMMTRPKKTANERRVILDLSWPIFGSINSGVSKQEYCGIPYKLRLPTADDAIKLILKHGPGCHMYSVDLARAFRQLRSDPYDWALLGIQWNQDYYVDMAIPFGIRWGSMCCQRMTNGISHIMQEVHHHDVLPYIDDFIGVEPSKEAAEAAFSHMQELMCELGVEEATAKALSARTCIIWIGLEFDSVAMELRMPKHKIDDTIALLRQWSHASRATLSQLRKLLGKLFHLGQASRPVRLFLNRMLETLRRAPPVGSIALDDSFQRDVAWFLAFLPSYNGIHLLDASPPSFIVEIDSCLTGCGGLSGGQFYHAQFPQFVLDQEIAISQLEFLNAVICVKLWHHGWAHSRVRIHCDNAAAVSVLNTGRGRDPFLLKCAREIWLLAALNDFEVEMVHTPGTLMSSADALSRCHLHPDFAKRTRDLTANMQRIDVDPYMFHLAANI